MTDEWIQHMDNVETWARFNEIILVLGQSLLVVVISVFIALFLYCSFKIYSAITLSSHKCVINSVFSVDQ